MRVTQCLAQRSQIAVDGGFADRRFGAIVAAPGSLQGPGLERVDVGFVNLIDAQIRPRPIGEQLAITLPVELYRSRLFRFRGPNPFIKRRLEFAQGGRMLALARARR